jgi:hypothetical protein
MELGTLKRDNLIAGDDIITHPVNILTGQSLLRGSVLGRKKYVCPTTGTAGSNTGNGTITAVRAGGRIKNGIYTVLCAEVAATFAIFNVTDPDGLIVGSVSVGLTSTNVAKFGSEQIQFSVTSGATAFIANDSFTITVSGGVPTTGTAGSNTGNGTCTIVQSRRNTKVGIYSAKNVLAATNGGKFEVTDPDGNVIGYVNAKSFVGTGNGTITEIIAGRNKQAGLYAVTCTVAATNGGTFSVKDPNDVVIGTITLPGTSTGSARFTSEEISFLLTDAGTDFIVGDKFSIDVLESDQLSMVISDGATDFALNDSFTVTVTIGDKDCVIVNSDNVDGSQDPYAVLLENVDATSADVLAAAMVSGEVNERALIFGGNDTIETHRDALRNIGINCAMSQEA